MHFFENDVLRVHFSSEHAKYIIMDSAKELGRKNGSRRIDYHIDSVEVHRNNRIASVSSNFLEEG